MFVVSNGRNAPLEGDVFSSDLAELDLGPSVGVGNFRALHFSKGSGSTSGSGMMDISEVAKYLKIKKGTAYRLAKDGKIRGAAKIGGQWRFKRDEVDLMFYEDKQGAPKK